MKLTHDYLNLPGLFYTRTLPSPVKEPELVLFNDELADELGLQKEKLRSRPGLFTGNEIPEGAIPIAQTYSGHQFGYFTRLGDGRAVLLGEIDTGRDRYDIQLKGAGRTPYSRGGDGRAALGPMLREYLISESMHALHIPTTRSLAVAATGETVRRETPLPGAVLTRVARGHIRVGTFQYALDAGGKEAVRALTDYVLARYGPQVSENKEITLFQSVAEKQAALIADWMRVGFIHGVMNTDNMSITGETIDYGPCAFLDEYDEDAVFSSIDRQGRYAYKNQPVIGKWNLARFAEALLGAADDPDQLLPEFEAALQEYDRLYDRAWLRNMAAKIGIADPYADDRVLVESLLDLMQKNRYDFTNTFVQLTRGEPLPDGLGDWQHLWENRLQMRGISKAQASSLMQQVNPVLIPRNHRVEQVIAQAEEGDLAPFGQLLSRLSNPYDYDTEVAETDTLPMPSTERSGYRTFCGT